MPVHQVAQAGADDLFTDLGGVLIDLLFAHRINGSDDGGGGEWVPGVGEATGEHAVVERGGDVRGDDDTAHRNVAGVGTFREHDEVWLGIPVLKGEPLAGAREAGHRLVGDPHDLVLVRQRPHTFEVSRRRHQDAGGSDDGFQNDRADGVRAFELDDLLEVLQRTLGLLLGTVRPER